ncbi:adenosine deaminase [Monoraphidium neglectum]|uniref:Adenosine deaminase n=1 Tax=Monoraphidium neglectum TaxID=145388 RepID=A0A0D2MYH3_9CHLO|nr:adenosine deaminase [Monoraphidium neglectum]KIZ07530.1 adenosine deaminase [Monoraphidium neglectum]|eukprot:XP_013906549.1 adenosine deaminase [Monoraphidium neglectum]
MASKPHQLLLSRFLLALSLAGTATAAWRASAAGPAQQTALFSEGFLPLHSEFRGQAALRDLIQRLPKAELHIHIEGTLEPELMFALAAKNGVELPYTDVEAARAARTNFTCLEDFLRMYAAATKVLITEDDFYRLAQQYLARAEAENIRAAEIFFDPQGHLARGVPLETVIRGLSRALAESPVEASLLLCVQREFGAKAAAEALTRAIPYLPKSVIIALGMDGSELGHPPRNFVLAYGEAAALRLHRVAHAGEEGGPSYVREALSLLGAERIDHGIRSLEDPALVAAMVKSQVPITLCPLSNLKLQVYKGQLEDRIRQVLASGMRVTINSDDPAYFGSYVSGNYEWVARIAGLGPDSLAALAANSFTSSFMPQVKQQEGEWVAAQKPE